MAKRRPAEFWVGHVEAWRQSGLTQVLYCARHGLGIKAFGRWLRKAREGLAQEGGLSLTLIPAGLVSPAPHRAVTLHSPGGWRIELSADVAGLADLLRQLP